VADGTVVAVKDDVPENFGTRKNPAVDLSVSPFVFVEHGGGLVSAYYHLRPGSAAVKVGQRVKAVQPLGRVGKAGNASEPHLHFGLMELDPTNGRVRGVPARIEGLQSPDGRPAAGVPKGTEMYLTHAAG
jgi:murein DD-endopeptidase MepM/ murein hydrolase activator NlpD